MKDESEAVQRAANLMREGAAMLAETCPSCGTPLFKIGTQISCARCNKPVVIVRGAEDEAKILRTNILGTTEQTLLKKIADVQAALEKENDPELMHKITENLTELLNALEKLRRS
ncbi:MAG: Sjogren's syndrome/scleroderma autoantigen 1 family protein [archaeon]